ncbi:ribonuclease H2 subunit C [Cajanus cajan]|uniref:Uncharacterized protein n=1 Tax=Cajanus cajan TaxID=3821 RepID=A0A151S9J5_CAJCA|nr:ribonuclease H2 subunit C [Cajanus cajan]KYP51448.1 hypothetical protein KK1_026733 [Cajanus cajan]
MKVILEAKGLRLRGVWSGRGKEMEKTSIDLKREGKGIEDLSGRVHQLPCCVKHNGPASVSHYFKPKPSPEGLPLQHAHFRGRFLQGTTLPLPHGYSGFLLATSSHNWDTHATFHDITYWNHDYAPSHNDELFRAFHWLTLAQALHNPVTPEELASSSVTL